MKNVGGVWLPMGEEHLAHWMHHDKHARMVDGKLTYQYHKLEAALAHCRSFRVAIDVGAHAGLWSMQLVKHFEHVHAFEPVALHRDCFERNLAFSDHWALWPYACGAEAGRVAITTRETSSGDSFVSGPGEIEMVTIDSMRIVNVDFIKVDVEGYELEVLMGAEETLKRCRPCVIVEQKAKNLARMGSKGEPAVDYLRALGAYARGCISGDWIVSWDA